MKKIYLLFVFSLFSFMVRSQNTDNFITTWEVTNSSLNIVVPIVENPQNNYTIDFGDGTILTNQTGNVSHTYSSAGTYTVVLSGIFKRIDFHFNATTASKLKTIEQWGTNQWESMERAFKGCSNLTINTADIPDLSQVTSMREMFYYAQSLNQSLNDWDVSNVTDMNSTFTLAVSFNQSLDNWDVSNVTDMTGMFSAANSFNQSIGNWNVSNVTAMTNMFANALSFNQPLGNWNVSNATNTERMFSGAISFNQPIGNWNVSNVTDMTQMFLGASSFNQSLNNWDVSNVTSIPQMFCNAHSFNQPLNNWDLSNVTNMYRVFYGATLFNQPLDNWDVSNVTNMAWMFDGATNFNQDLSAWNFNSDIFLGYNTGTPEETSFLSNSGLSIGNYDALLQKFAQLELQNKALGAVGLHYCDSDTHSYLINELEWIIYDADLAEDCSLEVNSSETDFSILFYPNPASDMLNIQTKGNIELQEVKIYNLQGRELFSSKQNLEAVNVENLSSGIYLLSIKTNERTITQKIIKR